ncbi:MAG: Flp pilus assembly complex ATPase component TadA [Candidatus Sericytochromatia bacterium]|nr:Flp pilus assembly complex ATPase component TadA [Candidatus Tanganyikabacteria bacterium]
MAIVKMKLGEILLNANLISEPQLKQAMEIQKATKESLGMILIKQGYVTEASIKDALELQYGLRYINLRKTKVPPEVLKLIPENLMRQHMIIPIALTNNRLTLAMVDPQNLIAVDDVRFMLKGVTVQQVVITEDEFFWFMDQLKPPEEIPEQLSGPLPDISTVLGEMAAEDELDIVEEKIEDFRVTDLERMSEESPIVKLANSILTGALGGKKVSDIHIEPFEEHIQVRYRIDGILHKQSMIPKKFLPALVSRLKIMAQLDIAEKRLPQDGRLRVKFKNRDIDFRVSTLPSKHGEKVVMRILDKSGTMLGLEKLFIYEEDLKLVREMCARPFGIIFVTGPTGSGKTTTLYSILNERNTPDVNISTAEDPIEYDAPGLTQVQAKAEIGMTFARILKAFLRQDPDIMLIGETRDLEVAKIAIESALTGHLVFTSLHTNDAPGAIMRLNEMGVENFLVSAATIGVIAQRLMRRLCNSCKEPYQPTPAELDFVGYRYNPAELPTFQKPVGCAACNKGYAGRLGCYEIMKMNDELRDLIARGATSALLRYAAKQSGMITLKDYSLKLVRDGHTSLEEVIRVTFSGEGEEKLCPGCRNPVGDEFVKCPFCQVDLKKLCPTCNKRIEEGWKSCPACGTLVDV